MLLITGASEASAGSAWGWGPTRLGGGGAPPSNKEMQTDRSDPLVDVSDATALGTRSHCRE